MKNIIFLISLSILLAVFVTPSFSSNCKKGQDYSGHFGDMDLDGNDQVNFEEFKKHFPHADEKTFKGVDENKDGSIDHDEWHAFKENHGYGHKNKD